MSDLLLDSARSHVRIHTFAEGLLARLAHDLELVCGGLSGAATRSGDDGATTGTARLEAPLRDLAVNGVLGKDGRLDERALSPGERHEILAKMQKEVFHSGPDGVVRVEASLDGGRAHVRLFPPGGKGVEVVVEPELTADGEALRAVGTFEVSLSSIGSDVIKAPMGAFRVKDRVRVSFDVVFAPPPAQPA
ncbi:hypothetical protein BH11MYX4_BH11MYX4_15920 [soil metagenome]